MFVGVGFRDRFGILLGLEVFLGCFGLVGFLALRFL